LNRAQRHAVGITALDPRAHHFAAMDEDLTLLAHGGTIHQTVLRDHLLGAIASRETIEPARDRARARALSAVHQRAARPVDVSVWLEPDPELKLAWTITATSPSRGYREEQVPGGAGTSPGRLRAYIAPQAVYADIRRRSATRGHVPQERRPRRSISRLSRASRPAFA